MRPPQVMLVGAGAIGGVVASRLTRAGHALRVVDADPDHVARLRVPGLVVEGDERDDPVALEASGPGERAPNAPINVLLLAVRSQHTETALGPWVDHLADDADVVSLQNGLNEERIVGLVGAERVVGCVVGFGATYHSPGHIEVTSDGELVIGRLDGTRDERLERTHRLLSEVARTRVSEDITGERWAKMLVNTVTVLGAIGGVLTGPLLEDPVHRPVIHRVLAEAVAVANAEGARPANVFGVDPDAIIADQPGWRAELDRILAAIAPHSGAVKSVTWRDLELGRPTEVGAVTGEVVRRAGLRGIPAPVNATALTLLEELEAGLRRPDPSNLLELAELTAEP